MTVYVVTAGELVLGVYLRKAHANLAAQFVTGATVWQCQVWGQLPDDVVDAAVSEHDDGGDTPAE